MLGLAQNEQTIAQRMITTSASLDGFESFESLDPVEGVVEIGYTKGFGTVTGGKLEEMIFDAKNILARAASPKVRTRSLALAARSPQEN